MSVTLKEISYNILNLYRGGRSTNNDHISLEQINFNVKHYRAMLIRRDFKRNGIVTRHFEQDLGCLDLIRVNASKCCDLPIECDVSRTVLKLPRTVRLNHREALTHIADPSGMGTIPLINSIDVQFLPYDRFTKNDKKVYMIEDYMYLYNSDGMDAVNVRGIFEDPEEVALFECGGANCYDPEDPFPISMDMVTTITEGLISGTLQLLPKTASDTMNDNIESTHLPVRGKGDN